MQTIWKRYFFGDKKYGMQRIEALLNLNAKNLEHLTGQDSDKIYYINYKGNICQTDKDSDTADLVLSNYTKIICPVWQINDLLYNEKNDEYAIFFNFDKTDQSTFNSFLCVSPSKKSSYLDTRIILCSEDYALATSEQKDNFLNYIHTKLGLDWDPKLQKIVKYKKKPNLNVNYYYISDIGKIEESIWKDDEIDNNRLRLGNCFLDKNIANYSLKLLKKFFSNQESNFI